MTGMNLYCETHGRGRDLVLLHGWAMQSTIWQPLLQRLTQHWRVTMIDLPGHGKSRATQLAKWDERLLDALLAVAPEQAVWLGWSISGMLALQLARHAADHVDKLVLVASNLKFPKSDDWPHAVGTKVLQQFHDDLVNDYQRTLQRFLALQVNGTDTARATLRQLRDLLRADLPPEKQTLNAGLVYLCETDLRNAVSDLQQDTLWLAGSHDTLVPVGAERPIQALLPDIKTHVFQGAGHAPFLSHSDEFIAVLKDFAYE